MYLDIHMHIHRLLYCDDYIMNSSVDKITGNSVFKLLYVQGFGDPVIKLRKFVFIGEL